MLVYLLEWTCEVVKDPTPDMEVDVLSHNHSYKERYTQIHGTAGKWYWLIYLWSQRNFVNFDAEIHLRMKAYSRGYEGYKPSPQYWVYMLEEDPEFAEEFKIVFNNADILEADDFTTEVHEYTYVDMDIVLTKDG